MKWSISSHLLLNASTWNFRLQTFPHKLTCEEMLYYVPLFLSKGMHHIVTYIKRKFKYTTYFSTPSIASCEISTLTLQQNMFTNKQSIKYLSSWYLKQLIKYQTSTLLTMNFGITLWNSLPLKCNILPDLPTPFSPVHKQRKFSAVNGTTSALWKKKVREAGH